MFANQNQWSQNAPTYANTPVKPPGGMQQQGTPTFSFTSAQNQPGGFMGGQQPSMFGSQPQQQQQPGGLGLFGAQSQMGNRPTGTFGGAQSQPQPLSTFGGNLTRSSGPAATYQRVQQPDSAQLFQHESVYKPTYSPRALISRHKAMQAGTRWVTPIERASSSTT